MFFIYFPSLLSHLTFCKAKVPSLCKECEDSEGRLVVSVDGLAGTRDWLRCRCVSGKTIRRTAMFLAVFKLYTHANIIYICYYSVWGAISSQELSDFFQKEVVRHTVRDVVQYNVSQRNCANLNHVWPVQKVLMNEQMHRTALFRATILKVQIQSCRHCLSTNWTFVKLSDNEPRMPIPLGFRSRRFWDEVISGPVGIVLSTPSVSKGRKARSCGCHEISHHSHVAVLRC